MNLRDMNYEYELPEEAIRPFERKVLESGLCDFAVPMSFFRYQGKQIIKYECSGYIALSDMRLNELKDIFEVLEQTMFGVIEFYRACNEAGIKPIIGCEVYTAARSRTQKDPDKDKQMGHLVLLAKNNQGYKNLIKIVSKGYTEGFYYKPRVDMDVLREYSGDIIALSACPHWRSSE